MRRPLLLVAAIAITAGSLGAFACSERRDQPQADASHLKTMDVAMPPPMDVVSVARPAPAPPAPPAARVALPGVESEPDPGRPAAIAQTAPRIAYSYGYRFRVPAASLAALQERHLQLCLSLGETRCRVVSMRRSEPRTAAAPSSGPSPPEPEAIGAALELQVASPLAERFGSQLAASTGEAGGALLDRQISAEDVSRQMVDSEARIRTRETLIRRLSALLETRSGNIEQAVEAERAINQAQEELDAARTWLAEMRGRVAMSRIAIAYEATGALAARPVDGNPIALSLQRIGALTTQSLALLLLIAGLVLPWAGVAVLIVLAARWHRRRTA